MSIEFENLPSGFEFIEVLGAGAQGTVVKARATLLERIVAIKFLNNDGSADMLKQIERIQNEARNLARLSHPGIVKVFQCGITDGGRPYIVCEFLEGKTLELVLLENGGRLPAEMLVSIFVQLLDALEFAHEKQLVHRDIKPGNIMLSLNADDGQYHVSLLDFSIARDWQVFDEQSSGQTLTTSLSGSPAYMSPEQCRGLKVGPASDLYSLSCVLFECVYGHPPFSGDTSYAILYKQIHEPVDSIIELKQSGLLSEFFKNALSKEVQRRPADAKAYRAELIKVLDKRVHKSNKAPSAVLLILLLSLLLISLSFYGLNRKAVSAGRSAPFAAHRSASGFKPGLSSARNLADLMLRLQQGYLGELDEKSTETVLSNIDREIKATESDRVLNMVAIVIKMRALVHRYGKAAEIGDLAQKALELSLMPDGRESLETGQVYLFRGLYHQSKNDPIAAEQDFRRSLSLVRDFQFSEERRLQMPGVLMKFDDPAHEVTALQHLAFALEAQHKYAEALQALDLSIEKMKVLFRFPHAVPVIIVKCEYLRRNGEKAKSDLLLESTLADLSIEDGRTQENSDVIAGALVCIARSYYQHGNRKKALAVMDSALALCRQHSGAMTNYLDRLENFRQRLLAGQTVKEWEQKFEYY